MNNKNVPIALALLAAGANLFPISAVAEEACPAGECTVVFEYSASEQIWDVPEGAINLRFEAYGASGARGGAGGYVEGMLFNLPRQVHVLVGGAGSEGAYAQGGFNGGGQAGGYRGNEGSGGGATDIRLSSDISTRIVVAGGGGGGGGYSGATGAPGGGLEADSGQSGQGQGGGGGSQILGGSGGAANGGGSPGVQGSFGQGGQGGVIWSAGGGGGGGGWFGGGGGGSDDNTCCSDGGGGGGGSSYASAEHVQSVSHQKGVNMGHGRLVLKFQIAPTLLESSGEQTSSQSALAQFAFDKSPANLSSSSFSVSPGCLIETVSTGQPQVEVLLSGCPHGSNNLSLRGSDLGYFALAGEREFSVDFMMDRVGPSFEWVTNDHISSTSTLILEYRSAGTLGSLDTNSFEVLGCNTPFQASVSSQSLQLECHDGLLEVRVRAGTLSDEWGNLGPNADASLAVIIDTSVPVISASAVSISGGNPFTYSFSVFSNEPVHIFLEETVLVSSQSCQLEVSGVESEWQFKAMCGYGSGAWVIPMSSILDRAGNRPMGEDLVVRFMNLEPETAAPQTEISASPDSAPNSPSVLELPEANPSESETPPSTPQPIVDEINPAGSSEGAGPSQAQEAAQQGQPVSPREEAESVNVPNEPTSETATIQDVVPVVTDDSHLSLSSTIDGPTLDTASISSATTSSESISVASSESDSTQVPEASGSSSVSLVADATDGTSAMQDSKESAQEGTEVSSEADSLLVPAVSSTESDSATTSSQVPDATGFSSVSLVADATDGTSEMQDSNHSDQKVPEVSQYRINEPEAGRLDAGEEPESEANDPNSMTFGSDNPKPGDVQIDGGGPNYSTVAQANDVAQVEELKSTENGSISWLMIGGVAALLVAFGFVTRRFIGK